MGLENPLHLLFVAAVALVVLGPRRLPELARALGHGIREFREAINGERDAAGGEREAIGGERDTISGGARGGRARAG